MAYGQGGYGSNGGQYGNGGGYGGQGGGNRGYGGGNGQGQGGQGNNGGGGGYGAGPQGGGNGNGGGYGGAPQGNGGGDGQRTPSPSLPDGFDKDNPYKSRIEACLNFEMRFSRYKGAKLGELREDDEALLFFDWLRQKQDFTGIARDMVTVFLHRPEIAARLDAAIQVKRANAKNRQNGNG